jgi:hypothetical protein
MTEQTINFYQNKPTITPKFERTCGECNLCCKSLLHTVNGQVHHHGKPCFYLGTGCTVYEKRPQSCRDYYCAYIQGLLPEWLKPNLSNLVVSVERWGPNKEFNMLRAVEVGGTLSVEALSWLIQFTREQNSGLIYQMHGIWYYFGPDEFMEEFSNLIIKPEKYNPFLTDVQP